MEINIITVISHKHCHLYWQCHWHHWYSHWHVLWHINWHLIDVFIDIPIDIFIDISFTFFWCLRWHLLLACSLTYSWAIILTYSHNNQKGSTLFIKLSKQVQLLLRILVWTCIKHKKVENPLVLLCFRRQMGLKRAF